MLEIEDIWRVTINPIAVLMTPHGRTQAMDGTWTHYQWQQEAKAV